MAAVWIGGSLRVEERTIPDYSTWTRRRLLTHVQDLEHDFLDAIEAILLRPKRSELNRVARWFADAFDQWQGQGGGLVTLCTAQAFEESCGLLRAREKIEVPPYAEMLVQGPHGLALRHPEYMLARDLAFLLSIYRNAEQLLAAVDWRRPAEWAKSGSENSQALARAVIQTCFNLMESFVSGLARSYVMTTRDISLELERKLLDNTSPLKKRLLSVPTLIAEIDRGLLEQDPAVRFLFGPIKQRRDAFVHCEPGPAASSRGYVKEAAFHDVSRKVVEDAVTATTEIITTIWRHVHGVAGPRWLPNFQGTPEELRSLRLARPLDGGIA
jgi:hypothetical protein